VVVYLAIFVMKNLHHVFSNFRHVFGRTLLSSFEICVVYLEIFVMYLAKPLEYHKNSNFAR